MKTALEMALQSGAFILLMALARPWMKKRLSARLRYALWLLPAVRLCLPFSLHSALSLWRYAQPALKPMAAPAPVAIAPVLSGGAQAALPIAPAVQPTYAALPAASQAQSVSFIDILPILWLAGAVLALMMMVYTNLRFLSAARGAETVQPGRLPVLLIKGIPSPCLAGLMRPRIYVNEKALASREMLDMVLLHETTHFKRKDHLWTLLRALLICLWWWNPLVWLAARLSRMDCEAACDEAVIGGMDTDGRRLYGMSLIALMRRVPEQPFALSIGTSMSGGKKQMKERIEMIARYTGKNKWIALAVILCAIFLAPMVMTGAAEQQAALSDQHLIEKAKETVMSHYVLDDGIEKFLYPRVVRGEKINFDGRTIKVDEVSLTAVNPTVEVPVAVCFMQGTDEAVRLTAAGDVWWNNSEMLQDQKDRIDKTAYIRDPRENQYAVSLCSAADDYGIGKEMLLNGTEAVAHWTTPTLGHYPSELFDDPKEEWAYVTVGANEHFEGASGYVPVACLAWEKPDDKAAPAFEGTVTADETKMYADTGLTDTVLTELKQGTGLRVLGRTMKYWHVEREGKTGFVPAEDFALAKEALAVLPAFGVDNLTTLQPGWEKRLAAYEEKRNILYNSNPPMGEWSLEQMAEGTRLAQEYGMLEEWITDANGVPQMFIVPGDGDLTEEEALRLADKQAMEKYGFAAEDVKRRSVSYSYPQDKPEERRWKVRYSLMVWQYDCSVTLNRKGEAVDFWQMKEASGPYPRPNMKAQDAVIKARQILIEKGFVPGETLSTWEVTQDYITQGEGLAARVSFTPPRGSDSAYRYGLSVVMDDATGNLTCIEDHATGKAVMGEKP